MSQRPNGPEPSVEEYPDEATEAAGMASRVRLLIALGVPPREIALLVRINAHTERFESALSEAGVPYTVRGGDRFYDRPEVKQAVVLLRGAARAGTDEADATGSMPAAPRGTCWPVPVHRQPAQWPGGSPREVGVAGGHCGAG